MMKFLIVCIITLASAISVSAQSILEEWEGTYEGQMIVGFTNRANDSLTVKFELTPIEPDSLWVYRLTYDSKTYGEIVKDYTLRRFENSTVDFELDEGDGIIIEMSLMNDCFYDVFEVMDNLYSATLRKIGDDVHFDLFMSIKKDATVSTSEEDEEGNVFQVTSYKPSLHQSVYLKRISID